MIPVATPPNTRPPLIVSVIMVTRRPSGTFTTDNGFRSGCRLEMASRTGEVEASPALLTALTDTRRPSRAMAQVVNERVDTLSCDVGTT